MHLIGNAWNLPGVDVPEMIAFILAVNFLMLAFGKVLSRVSGIW